MKKFFIAIVMILLLIACSDNSIDENKEKPLVYATIFPVYSLTESIAGDVVDLHMVVPDGVDAHDFEPSAKLIAEIGGADLLISNGLELEYWLEDSEQVFVEAGLKQVEVAEGIETLAIDVSHDKKKHEDYDKDEEHAHHHGDFDPHIWLSIENAKTMSTTIYQALSEIVAESDKAELDVNYQQTLEKLDQLQSEYQAELSTIKQKKLVVGHAAFAYLCKDWDLEQVAIAGLSSMDEPSARVMAEIASIAKEDDVKVIFYDAFGSDKLAKVIADETSIDLKPLNTLEMSGDGRDYFELMRENLENLKLIGND